MDSVLFPEFTFRTTLLLWIVFIALFMSIFRRHLPGVALVILLVLNVTGIFACLPFVMNMMPFMLFGWIFIFVGIGVFPYSPIIGLAAFVAASVKMAQTLRESHSFKYYRAGIASIVITLLFTVAYSGLFLYRWRSISDSFVSAEGSAVHEAIDADLSPEIRAAKYLTADHVLEMYMKTNNRSLDSIFDFLPGRQGNYDLFGSTASLIFSDYPSPRAETRESLMNLIFRTDYTAYESIWGYKNTYTSEIRTRVQLFPAIRAAYVESVLTVRNSSDQQEEAIYTIHVPEGSAASRLGLWINGKEESSRLTLKSKAQRAYHQIVNVESRDPSILEWRDGSRYRLKVFPIPPRGFRTVRVGFTVPLAAVDGELLFTPVRFEGPGMERAKSSIAVDLFTDMDRGKITFENISFDEALVSDGSQRSLSYKGPIIDHWKIHLGEAGRIEGVFVHGGFEYEAHRVAFASKSVNIRQIFIVLDASKNPDEWIAFYKKIANERPEGSSVYLVGDRLYYSKDINNIEKYINSTELPNFNLFPYYRLKDPEHSLVISSAEEHSLTYGELSGTEFYRRSENFFSGTRSAVLTAITGKKSPAYLKSLEETGRIFITARGEDRIGRLLKERSFTVVERDADLMPVAGTDIAIKRSRSNEIRKSGEESSHLMRLFTYARVNHDLGRRALFSDADHPDLYRMVRSSNIVSPISSLIVLESENDYQRFDIKKNQKGDLAQAKIASIDADDSPLGMVPEPEEYALLALLLLLFAFIYRKRIIGLIRSLRFEHGLPRLR
jgi:XrtN system VIT domain protein